VLRIEQPGDNASRKATIYAQLSNLGTHQWGEDDF